MPKANDFLKGHTFRTLMNIMASDGKIPSELMVLPVGDWTTQSYGPMQVNASHLAQIVANFKSGVRKLVPVDVDHDGGKAAGWIKELTAKDDGLYAQVEWTKYGEELLNDKIYRLFSPEWSFDYVDPEYGSRHGAVLVAGSLTNRPLFKELPVLMASDGSGSGGMDLTNPKSIMILLESSDKQTMNIKDILSKPVADRTPEEVKFLAENAADFTDEQKSQVETEKADAEKAEAEAKEKAEKEEAEKAEKEKAEKEAAEKAEAERKANEGKTVTISASELAELKKAKEANEKAQTELRRSATEKELNAFMASEKGGKILPKAFEGGALVDMVLTFSETQKKSFLAFVDSLPEIKIAGEGGSDDNNHLTAHQQLSKLVDERVKASEGKLNAAEAWRQVISANEALAKQYQLELQSSKK